MQSPMKNQIPILLEINNGICEFMNPSTAPFKGIIKHRYSDFHVNEVDLLGNTVHITNLKVQQEEITQKSAVVEDELPDDEKVKLLTTQLGLDDDFSSRFTEFLASEDSSSIESPCLPDKATRTEVHRLVRQQFDNRVGTSTKAEEDIIVFEKFNRAKRIFSLNKMGNVKQSALPLLSLAGSTVISRCTKKTRTPWTASVTFLELQSTFVD